MYFIKAQESRNEWWRYILTILIVLFAQLLGAIPLYIILFIKQLRDKIDISGFKDSLNFEILGLNQNMGLILLLNPSVITFIAILLMMVFLHKQKLGAIFSASGKIRWGRMLTGSIIWLILLIIAELIASKVHPGNYVFHFDSVNFIPLVFIVVILIPLQAGSEELLFRSYLMQGTGLLFHSRAIALFLTSVAFGLMHSLNPEVNEFGFWSSMVYYIGFGLIAGLLVIYDNGIELAIGVHAINNIYGCLFVTYDSSVLQTAALWKLKKLDITLMNIGFVVMAVVLLVTMAIIYKWKDWGKLWQRIQD
jgi:membrane protease YdiL (CAAX protease family)